MKNLKICDECQSQYKAETSKMENLCPNVRIGSMDMKIVGTNLKTENVFTAIGTEIRVNL